MASDSAVLPLPVGPTTATSSGAIQRALHAMMPPQRARIMIASITAITISPMVSALSTLDFGSSATRTL
jgi:hypothetical protein